MAPIDCSLSNACRLNYVSTTAPAESGVGRDHLPKAPPLPQPANGYPVVPRHGEERWPAGKKCVDGRWAIAVGARMASAALARRQCAAGPWVRSADGRCAWLVADGRSRKQALLVIGEPETIFRVSANRQDAKALCDASELHGAPECALPIDQFFLKDTPAH